MLFRICTKLNLHLQAESTYGSREQLEKQDFIIEKQYLADTNSLKKEYENLAQRNQEIAALISEQTGIFNGFFQENVLKFKRKKEIHTRWKLMF